MPRWLVRFAIEAAPIVAAAAIAWAVSLPRWGIFTAVFGTWIVVALADLLVARLRAQRARAPRPARARTRPRPEPDQPVEPQPVVQHVRPPEPVTPILPPAAGAQREWNLWELERLARERAGRDPLKDEEWAFLFVYLREFADPDGMLPAHFDGLVRESFADLIGTPAR